MVYFNSPCLNCENRVLGCHSTCKDYIIYKEKNYKLNEQRKMDEALNRMEIQRAMRTKEAIKMCKKLQKKEYDF